MAHGPRRNNVLPGMLLLGGAIAIGASTLGAWAKVSGPDIALGNGKIGFNAIPNMSASSDSDATTILLVTAGVIAVSGLLLIATRVRALGLLWRLIALAGLVLPAILAVALWRDVTGDPAQVLSDPNASFVSRLGGLLTSGLENLGLVSLTPGSGLWLLTGGGIAVLIGIVVPAIRVPVPNTAANVSNT